VLLSAAALCAAAPAEKKADNPPPAAEEPKFDPGKETRVEDASLGEEGYYIVYVPPEYTPDRTWPVIFCYHGINGKPTVWPFKDVVGGKGFIVVGMGYAGGPGGEAYAQASKDIANVRRLASVLTKQLKLDPRQFFIGGFSMGGFMCSTIGEGSSDLWCAMMICGAGRGGRGGNADSFRNKPVFVGAGEKDPNLATATKAADTYRGVGAIVTMETWAGMGHSVDTGSKILADFLWSNGPLKKVKADLAEAKALQAGAKLGLAYVKYKQAADAPGGGDPAAEAGKAAEEIAKEAETQLAAADAAVADKKYADAMTALKRLATTYAGSPFGDRAAKSLTGLQSDPTVSGAIDQARTNAQGKALEDQAGAAEIAKDYGTAIRLYEQLVTTCPKSDRVEAARERLAKLKGDKAVQSAIVAKDADRDCRAWLAMADNFAQAGSADQAREYLQKIIAKYPGTDWAKQAGERLKKIK
jgi:poly(3-hydroxybutyrate) depolymerase/TolA-binding protein